MNTRNKIKRDEAEELIDAKAGITERLKVTRSQDAGLAAKHGDLCYNFGGHCKILMKINEVNCKC